MKATLMKSTIVSAIAAVTLAGAAQAGDPALGKQKAGSCVLCHGNDSFPGIFYTLQLAGRDADKLAIKTAKYANGKVFHPVMNLFTNGMKESDIADISAYYQSLGKPFLSAPFITIKGDEEAPGKIAGAY